MYYTGFADEAARDIDTQIRATRELGWKHIESRAVDGINITDVSDEAFDRIAERLRASGVSISCFGSAVANWGKDPRKQEDFDRSVAELSRALPRMKKVGCGMIRGMSFTRVRDQRPDAPEIEREVFRKLTVLVRMCEEAGVLYLHENCANYGGLSYEHTLKLLDAITSKSFALVYDTGNPATTFDHRGPQPYKLQSSWEFYRNVKPFIRSVHIKDGTFLRATDGVFAEARYTWPGEGNGDVRRIVADLLAGGYDGGFSIEPHMAAVFHDPSKQSPQDAAYWTYVEYGKRFMKLVEECREE
ncbi:MAG TPA: sugar phosphate isomerase/epimerase family protein [Spirochaetia bacterium]|nr:sugar phosphate isomerase/epimerase family protein [Spirochaetia bacterium]